MRSRRLLQSIAANTTSTMFVLSSLSLKFCVRLAPIPVVDFLLILFRHWFPCRVCVRACVRVCEKISKTLFCIHLTSQQMCVPTEHILWPSTFHLSVWMHIRNVFVRMLSHCCSIVDPFHRKKCRLTSQCFWEETPASSWTSMRCTYRAILLFAPQCERKQ